MVELKLWPLTTGARALYLLFQDSGFLGCRVVSGSRVSMHFHKCASPRESPDPCDSKGYTHTDTWLGSSLLHLKNEQPLVA